MLKANKFFWPRECKLYFSEIDPGKKKKKMYSKKIFLIALAEKNQNQ